MTEPVKGDFCRGLKCSESAGSVRHQDDAKSGELVRVFGTASLAHVGVGKVVRGTEPAAAAQAVVAFVVKFVQAPFPYIADAVVDTILVRPGIADVLGGGKGRDARGRGLVDVGVGGKDRPLRF